MNLASPLQPVRYLLCGRMVAGSPGPAHATHVMFGDGVCYNGVGRRGVMAEVKDERRPSGS